MGPQREGAGDAGRRTFTTAGADDPIAGRNGSLLAARSAATPRRAAAGGGGATQACATAKHAQRATAARADTMASRFLTQELTTASLQHATRHCELRTQEAGGLPRSRCGEKLTRR